MRKVRFTEEQMVAIMREADREPVAVAKRANRRLRHALWLSVAPVAEGPSALEHGLSLVCSLNHALVLTDRERVGREASPSTAIIDSQSIKTTEAGGPRGYDAGKKINGRKRHALVDTDGRGLLIEPHPASIQDRDGGGPLLQASRRLFPFIERVFADGGYAGERVATATRIIVEIVAKSPDQIGFAVLPRRWVVERFFAWIGRNRRLAKDFEASIDSAGLSFTPLPSCCSHAASQGTHEFRNRLLEKISGNADGDTLMAAMKGMSWESPRGQIAIDPETRDIIQNEYIRRVEKVNGELYNVEFATIEAVKDPFHGANNDSDDRRITKKVNAGILGLA